MLIFDYTQPGERALPPALDGEIGRRMFVRTVKSWMSARGWRPLAETDMTDRYVGWYDDLVRRIATSEPEILATAGRDWYEYVLSFYTALRDALAEGHLGGAVVVATAA